MPRTQAEEQRYQYLLSILAPAPAPAPPPEPSSALAYAGQEVANLLPRAGNDLINMAQGVMGVPQEYRNPFPDLMTQAAPQGLAQGATRVIGGIAAALPSFAVPEVAGASLLSKFGAAERVAKIGGATLGWAAPMADEGLPTAAASGATGALQTAARDWGWKGRAAAGVIGAGLGYAEGAQHGDTTAGLVQAGVNLAMPIVVDPLLSRLFQTVPKAAVKPAATTPATATPASPSPLHIPQPGEMSPFSGNPLEGQPIETGPHPNLHPPIVPGTGGVGGGEMQPWSGHSLEGQPIELGIGGGQPIVGQPFSQLRGTAPDMSLSRANGEGLEVLKERGLGAVPEDVSMMPQPMPAQPVSLGLPNVESQLGLTAQSQLNSPSLLTNLQPRPKAPEGALLLRPQTIVARTGMESAPMIGHSLAASGLAPTGGLAVEQGLGLGIVPKSKETSAPVSTKQLTSKQLKAEAAKNGASYDSYDPLTKQYQFTLQDAGKESTFYIAKDKLTPERIEVAIESKRAEMSAPQVNQEELMAAIEAGKLPEFLAAHKVKEETWIAANKKKVAESAPEVVVANLQPHSDLGTVHVSDPHGDWVPAKVLARDDKGNLQVEVQDPIMGNRLQEIHESQTGEKTVGWKGPTTRPEPFRGMAEETWIQKMVRQKQIDRIDLIAELEKLTPEQINKRSGPKDIEFNPHVLKLTKDYGLRESDGPIRSVAEEIAYQKSLLKPDEQHRGTVMSGAGPHSEPARGTPAAVAVEAVLSKLPKEAGDVLRAVLTHWTEATGQHIDLHFSNIMGANTKASAFETSGRIGFNLQRTVNTFGRWAKMSSGSKDLAVMEFAKTLGHEITHIAQGYGERSGLTFNGKPLLQAVIDATYSLTELERYEIQRLIKKAQGSMNENVSAYLSGNLITIRTHYERVRGPLTDAQVRELGAGEFLAEIGSVELAKRAQIGGLGGTLRAILDQFKGVVVRAINWLRGTPLPNGVANLQELQSIAGKVFDHFAAADHAALHRAYPASEVWAQARPSAGGGLTSTGQTGWHGPTAPTPPRTPVAPKPLPTPSVPTGTPPSQLTQPIEVKQQEWLKGELVRLGVRGVLGGSIGGVVSQFTPNQLTTGEGILLGGVLGMAGPAVAKRLLNTDLGMAAKASTAASRGSALAFVKNLFAGRISTAMAQAGASRGIDGQHAPAMALFARMLEEQLGINMPAEFKGLIENGKGLPQEQVSLMYDSFRKAQNYQVNDAMLQATDDFLHGKLSQQGFNALLRTPDELNYGQFINVMRASASNLTQMVAEGLPAGAYRNHLVVTADKYVGRFYRAHTEGKFNEDAFVAARADMMKAYPQMTADVAEREMRNYQAKTLADRRMFGKSGSNKQAIGDEIFKRRLATEDEIAAQQVVVAGLEHDLGSAAHAAAKAKLDWMLAHTITNNYRVWLGEITNPHDRMLLTVAKLYSNAIASKTISLLDDSTTKLGLRYSYTREALIAEQAKLEARLPHAAGSDLANLQAQLAEIKSYMPLDQSTAYGRLSGKWVNRFARDELSTYDNAFKWMDQPVMRSIARFNNMIKVGHTAFNPLTMLRNYIQLPMFMLMSGTKFHDLGSAWNVMRNNTDADLLSVLRRRHIAGVDFVSAELGKGVGAMFSGHFDADVAVRAGRKGYNAVLEAYQVPDQMHRVSTFITARDKFLGQTAERLGLTLDQAKQLSNKLETAPDYLIAAQKLGLSSDHAHALVKAVDNAQAHTERYSMNYSAVPYIVKAARQLPFVSLFVSYASEITKILKNLAQDVIAPGTHEYQHSRLHAMAVLGSMVALPAITVAAAKSALSPQDQADWDKVEKASPDYARSRFRVPTSRDAQGRFHFFDITNLLPADNYSQMVKAALSGDTEAALKANPFFGLQDTPLLNIVSEQISGVDNNTAQKFAGWQGRLSEIAKEVLPPVIPPGYEGTRLQQAFSMNNEGNLGLTNLKSGVSTTPSDIVWNYITSVKQGNVMLSTVQRQAMAEARDEIAILQVNSRRVLNSTAPDSAKQVAAEHLQQVSQEVLKRLGAQLN